MRMLGPVPNCPKVSGIERCHSHLTQKADVRMYTCRLFILAIRSSYMGQIRALHLIRKWYKRCNVISDRSSQV